MSDESGRRRRAVPEHRTAGCTLSPSPSEMSRADDGGRSCRNGSAPTHLYHGRSARVEPWVLNTAQHFIAAQIWHIVSLQPELNPQKSRPTNDTFLPT